MSTSKIPGTQLFAVIILVAIGGSLTGCNVQETSRIDEPAPAASAQKIEAHIFKELNEQSLCAENTIHVELDGGFAHVDGQVSAWNCRSTVDEALRASPGLRGYVLELEREATPEGEFPSSGAEIDSGAMTRVASQIARR